MGRACHCSPKQRSLLWALAAGSHQARALDSCVVQPETTRLPEARPQGQLALTVGSSLAQVWQQQQHHVLWHPRWSERTHLRVAVPADFGLRDPERGLLRLRIGHRR